MSLLQHSPDIEDDVSGESYTKGSGHLLLTSVIAAILVTIGIAVYVITGQKPPAATGDIIQVWAHAQHTQSSGFDANGAPMPQDSFDQVLVFTHVTLHNQSTQPLFLLNAMTNATLDDGIHSSYAATAVDYDRIFLAYPDIPVQHGKALALDSAIPPGQSIEGTIVSSFRLTKQQWDARKDLNFSFNFRYQPTLKLTPHSAVIDR